MSAFFRWFLFLSVGDWAWLLSCMGWLVAARLVLYSSAKLKDWEHSMACCKCEKYGWRSRPKETYKISDDGKEYCLFHAPAGKKMIGKRTLSVGEFNVEVFKRIEIAIGQLHLGGCYLSGAVFPGDISFSHYGENTSLPGISFLEASFLGNVSFSSTLFSGVVMFDAAKFNRRANFSTAIFHEDVWFHNTEFNAEVKFIKTMFKRCSFKEITGEGELFFDSCNIDPVGKMTFSAMDLGRCQFFYSDMTNIQFRTCKWPESDGRYCIYSERSPGNNLAVWENIRDFYQRMKRKYKDEHNEYEASEWHIAEKEALIMLLKEETTPLRETVKTSLSDMRVSNFHEVQKRFIYNGLRIYKWLSGFGEKPFQAFLCLAVLILLPLLPFVFPGDMRCYIPLLKIGPAKGQWAITHVWMIIWQLIVTIQAALFGFAVRNKFRR